MIELKEFIEKHTEIEWFELFWFEGGRTNPNVGHFWIYRYDIDNEYSFVGSRKAALQFADEYDCWQMPDTEKLDGWKGENDWGMMQMCTPIDKTLRVTYYADRTWQENDNYADDETAEETVIADYEYGCWKWSNGEDRSNIRTFSFEEIAEKLPHAETTKIGEFHRHHPEVKNIQIIEVRQFVSVCPLYCWGAKLNYLAVRRGRYIAKDYDLEEEDMVCNFDWILDGTGCSYKGENLEFQWLENDTLRVVRVWDNLPDDVNPDVILECETEILRGPFDDDNNPTDRFVLDDNHGI